MKHRKLAPRRAGRHAVALGTRSLHVVEDQSPRYIANDRKWPRRMYALAFDLDTSTLKQTYHNSSYTNAYEDIRRVLAKHHFDRQQGSVYFGDADKVDAVHCVLAVQDLTRQFSWFASAVNDLRMLRIEENNDLMPAVEEVVATRPVAAPDLNDLDAQSDVA